MKIAKITITLVLILLFLPVVIAAGDLEDGITAFDGQDYEEAFRLLKPLADENIVEAFYYIGRLYAEGNAVNQDYTESEKWFKKGAVLGEPQCQHGLAYLYANGYSVDQDFSEAFKWYQKAADQGLAKSQFGLGVMYENGHGVEKNVQEAIKWYRKAAEQGFANSQYLLGLMYAKGEDVPGDIYQALKWYRMAAEQGHKLAQNNLGVMYAKGSGVPQDLEKAVFWYRKASEQGNANAQNNLGVMFMNGQGVSQDYDEAVKWYRLAAENGDAAGQFNLGSMYMKGQGVPQDTEEAMKWYRKAAEQGSADALIMISGLDESEFLEDPEQWADLYIKAVDQGLPVSPKVLDLMGVAYAKGENVEKSMERALELWHKAADLGYAPAMANIGYAYFRGDGVPIDMEESKKWYQRSINSGNEEARVSMQMLFGEGLSELGEELLKDVGQTPSIAYVLILRSDPAFTIFITIPGLEDEEMLNELEDEIGEDVQKVTWEDFIESSDEFIKPAIAKNEYEGFPIEKAIVDLLERLPLTEVGLTWNGGVAITRHDYDYARELYNKYGENPEEYEQTRSADTGWDPIHPGHHHQSALNMTSSMKGESDRLHPSSPPAATSGININDLIKESQKQSQDANKVSLVWWLCQPFWEVALAETLEGEALHKAARIFEPYVVMGVVDGTMGPFGGMSLLPEEVVRENIFIVRENGERQPPLPAESVEGYLKTVLLMMKPVFANMLGQFGQGMNFFVFSGVDEDGSRIYDVHQEGRLNISLGGETFNWRLPLATVLPRKKCSKCGEEMQGNYYYCPWDGTKL